SLIAPARLLSYTSPYCSAETPCRSPENVIHETSRRGRLSRTPTIEHPDTGSPCGAAMGILRSVSSPNATQAHGSTQQAPTEIESMDGAMNVDRVNDRGRQATVASSSKVRSLEC